MGGSNGAGASPCASCSADEQRSDLLERLNAHIAIVVPVLTYTALAEVHWVGDYPMLVHRHPKDDSLLTGQIAQGHYSGGGCLLVPCFVQMGLLLLHGSVCGRDLLWGHIVDPRYGVMVNALRPHVPLPWSGQHIMLIPYTSIAWGRQTVAMQIELVAFGFPKCIASCPRLSFQGQNRSTQLHQVYSIEYQRFQLNNCSPPCLIPI